MRAEQSGRRPIVAAMMMAVIAAAVVGPACRSGTAASTSSIDEPRGQDNDGSSGESAPVPPPEQQGPIERNRDAYPDFTPDATGPGSDAAYRSLVADLEASLPSDVGTPPWPDLRNPDPAIVYEDCSRFQNWIAEVYPDPALVDGYAAPGSPEWGWDIDLFAEQRSLGLWATPATPPYTLTITDVVDPGASPISDELLELVPAGSAAVIYFDSVGQSSYVDGDGNVIFDRDGWSDAGPWVAIMEPTDAGWRVWWDELVEVPPGDEWDRGPQSRRQAPGRA